MFAVSLFLNALLSMCGGGAHTGNVGKPMHEMSAQVTFSNTLNNWIILGLQVLCAVLEFELSGNADLKMQIVTTLQSTSPGRKAYEDLSDRMTLLHELVGFIHLSTIMLIFKLIVVVQIALAL